MVCSFLRLVGAARDVCLPLPTLGVIRPCWNVFVWCWVLSLSAAKNILCWTGYDPVAGLAQLCSTPFSAPMWFPGSLCMSLAVCWCTGFSGHCPPAAPTLDWQCLLIFNLRTNKKPRQKYSEARPTASAVVCLSGLDFAQGVCACSRLQDEGDSI